MQNSWFKKTAIWILSTAMIVNTLPLNVFANESAENMASPDPVQKVLSSETPDLLPKETASQTPDAQPDETPSQTPDEMPSRTPDALPGEMPSRTPDASPGEMPSRTPDASPGEMPSRMPDASPGEMPSRTPDASPGETPAASLTPEGSLEASPSADIFPSASPDTSADPDEEKKYILSGFVGFDGFLPYKEYQVKYGCPEEELPLPMELTGILEEGLGTIQVPVTWECIDDSFGGSSYEPEAENASAVFTFMAVLSEGYELRGGA